MISKKSRKVVAALLIGATICASGTFAYFNATTNLSDIDGVNDDGADKLAITNGYIEIKGKIKGSTATKTSELWAYDVARVSTLKDMGTNADFKKLMNTTYGIPNDATTKTGMAMVDSYIKANRSPDILGLTDDVKNVNLQKAVENAKKKKEDLLKNNPSADTTSVDQEISDAQKALSDSLIATRTDGRAAIGTGVAGAITQARPGDAFALGGAIDGQDITESGIEIVNKSNLTTKIGIGLNTNDLDNVKAQLDAMNANGWKVYIKVSGVDATSDNPYADWREINSAFVNDGDGDDEDTICQIASVKPGDSNPILQMRVELPLLTQNDQQKKSTGEELVGGLSDLDIADMFEIVATQENNPGWNQLGSSDRPIETTTPATK